MTDVKQKQPEEVWHVVGTSGVPCEKVLFREEQCHWYIEAKNLTNSISVKYVPESKINDLKCFIECQGEKLDQVYKDRNALQKELEAASKEYTDEIKEWRTCFEEIKKELSVKIEIIEDQDRHIEKLLHVRIETQSQLEEEKKENKKLYSDLTKQFERFNEHHEICLDYKSKLEKAIECLKKYSLNSVNYNGYSPLDDTGGIVEECLKELGEG